MSFYKIFDHIIIHSVFKSVYVFGNSSMNLQVNKLIFDQEWIDPPKAKGTSNSGQERQAGKDLSTEQLDD